MCDSSDHPFDNNLISSKTPACDVAQQLLDTNRSMQPQQQHVHFCPEASRMLSSACSLQGDCCRYQLTAYR